MEYIRITRYVTITCQIYIYFRFKLQLFSALAMRKCKKCQKRIYLRKGRCVNPACSRFSRRRYQLPHHTISRIYPGGVQLLSHLRRHPRQCQSFANQVRHPRHIFHQSKPHHPQVRNLRLRPAPRLAHRLLRC